MLFASLATWGWPPVRVTVDLMAILNAEVVEEVMDGGCTGCHGTHHTPGDKASCQPLPIDSFYFPLIIVAQVHPTLLVSSPSGSPPAPNSRPFTDARDIFGRVFLSPSWARSPAIRGSRECEVKNQHEGAHS